LKSVPFDLGLSIDARNFSKRENANHDFITGHLQCRIKSFSHADISSRSHAFSCDKSAIAETRENSVLLPEYHSNRYQATGRQAVAFPIRPSLTQPI